MVKIYAVLRFFYLKLIKKVYYEQYKPLKLIEFDHAV